MSEFIIVLTVIACICLAGIVFYGIFVKAKEEQEDNDCRDEELESIYDNYGRNEYN
ncbi:MAG: hypothetical protein ACOC22_01225 [bacterium]